MSIKSMKLINSFKLLSCKISTLDPYLFRTMASQTYSENPFYRTLKIFRDDIKYRNVKDREFFPSHCDVLVVGGGVMGSSIAFWLKFRGLEGLRVAVVEKDPTVMLSDNNSDKLQYLQNTSTLSVGGLRQQFSLKENIELSLRSAHFFRNIKDFLTVDGCDPPDIQFHPSGYLFLASEKGASILEENYQLQRTLGAKVELISPSELKNRFPWLNTEGIVLGSHGLENEGWFDPYSLLFALKRKAVALGAEYVSGEVLEFEENALYQIPEAKKVHTALVRLANGEVKRITFGLLVIAAGGLSGHVAKLIDPSGTYPIPPLPVEPRKRYVFVVHCPNGPGVATPMVIDTSGAYFRRDGMLDHYLCGMSPLDEEEPPIDNLDVDYSFFEEKIWPILAHRVPGFESAKVKTAWAGFYDFNNFDENAFIGPYPGCANVLLATGFSGHGIQQAPAVGKAIMELIIEGQYLTVNLERFHVDRLAEGKPLWETNII